MATIFMNANTIDALEAFVIHVNKISNEYFEKNYPSLDKPLMVIEPLSDKWVRIAKRELRTESDGTRKYRTTSVWGFVCIKDYSTKALGTLKLGDVHKAASFKVAAKTARGSIFDEATWCHMTVYGPEYLRG